jgi:SSS family solute:Na+ symporter
VALKLAHSQGSALSLYYTITAIVAGGLAGLFLLAFLFKRATRKGAIAGIAANLIFTIWATLTLNGKMVDMGRFNFSMHEYMIGAVGHFVLLAFGILFSLILPNSTPSNPELTLWGWLQHNSPAHPEHVLEKSNSTP